MHSLYIVYLDETSILSTTPFICSFEILSWFFFLQRFNFCADGWLDSVCTKYREELAIRDYLRIIPFYFACRIVHFKSSGITFGVSFEFTCIANVYIEFVYISSLPFGVCFIRISTRLCINFWKMSRCSLLYT